jgi:Tannase and feruloyl esterase
MNSIHTAMAGAAGAVLLAGTAGAQTAGDCAALEGLRIEDTNLLSAAVVPATDDLPAYCRVLGYVRPAVNFEIRLPNQNWNAKFYMAGCGAQCGKLEADRPDFSNAMNHGLRRNYAAATMDGGHWGSSRSDTAWLQVRGPDRPL